MKEECLSQSQSQRHFISQNSTKKLGVKTQLDFQNKKKKE